MMMRNRRSGGIINGKRQPQKDLSDDTPKTPVQWRRMLGYLWPYRRRLLLALITMFISAGLSLVFPAVIQQVIDSVLEQGDLALLNQVTVLLLLVFLVRSVASLIETYNLNWIGEKIVVDLRKQLYIHLQDMSLRFFTERRVGELVSRISSDVTMMRNALVNNASTLLQQSLVMIGAIVVMFILNWRLTMFIVALIPVVVLIGFAFGYYLRRVSTEVQDELAEATVVVEEVFQGIREVKSFVREPYEINRHESAINRAFRAAVKLLRIRAVFGPTVGFMAFGGLSLILWFGGREVLEGRLTGGQLIAFLVYGLTVAGSFASLVGLYTQFQEAIGATRRVFQLMDMQPEIIDAADAIILDRVAGRITFDEVSFSYDDRQPVLDNVHLEIASGEVLALVGPSGAGKSTVFNLIPRFYDPTDGEIRVDGVDLRRVTQASLRGQIGIVPQETLLFGGTIQENIRYGRLGADDEEIIAAAKAANAHDFIVDLPDGYETIVGERGVRLSGGQRQRVAIARAILKDPRILLLDEATSSLDSESEHLVQEALARLMKGRTTVIIAHRLSTIRVADRIAVLNRGQIIELGTHDELMARGGLYAKLYEMQFHDQDLLSEPGTD
jgi:ATP-binding cassette, subfamily B, bacterial MsbA